MLARRAMQTITIAGSNWSHTVGIRDACELAVALPTGPNKLGWAMES